MGQVQVAIAAISLGVIIAVPNTNGLAQAKGRPGTTAAPQQGEYVFRSTVRRVPVDVVVLDERGNPVHGLSKNDFVVEEDGKRQKVLSFDASDHQAQPFTPPKIPKLPPNTFVNLPAVADRGPLCVLYYDLVNTSPADQMAFRTQLLKFVDETPAGTRIALFVNMKKLYLMQGFTSDHALLREAILRKGPPPSIPNAFLFAEVFGGGDVGGALSNLRFIAEYLAGLPERKNLIWLSSQFPIPVGPAAQNYGNGPTVVLDLFELHRDLIKQTYAAMMRSRVALYPVDVSGVGPLPDKFQSMDMIAAATGGHAYYSDNQAHSLIDKAVEHGESYYTLTYSPENANFDGSRRQIRVKLAKDNKHYALTYRTLYYAVSDEDAEASHAKEVTQKRFLAAKAQDTLYATVEHGAPMMHDVLFAAHVATAGEPRMATADEMKLLEDSPVYFRTRKRNKDPKPLNPVKLQQYVINYDIIDPQLRSLATSKQRSTVLEFAAAAYNNEGALLNSILNQGTLTSDRSAEGKAENRFHAVQELQVPPGAAYIRLVVRNTQNDRSGALEVKLPLKQVTETAAAGGISGGALN